MKVLNIANILTMSRIAAVPVLMVLLMFNGVLISFIAFLVFLAAVLTDLLDGYLARRNKIVSNLGRLLDPLADKLINAAALIMLIPLGRVPAWLVFLLIARDTAITGLRAMASSSGVVIEASVMGKAKTVFQNIAICLLIIHYPVGWIDPHFAGNIFLGMALVITYWSGVEYFIKFYRVLREETNP